MKTAIIVVAVIDLLLLFGAGLRLAIAQPDTPPLFNVSSLMDSISGGGDSSSDEGGPGFGEEGTKGGDVANHLKGRSWESGETSSFVGGGGSAPRSGGTDTSIDQFNRAEKVLDNRDDDLDGAKKKMGKLVGGD